MIAYASRSRNRIYLYSNSIARRSRLDDSLRVPPLPQAPADATPNPWDRRTIEAGYCDELMKTTDERLFYCFSLADPSRNLCLVRFGNTTGVP